MGASSDHLMIDLKEEINYKVGDCIPFSLEYEALSQLMYHQRMENIIVKNILFLNVLTI